MYLRFLAVDRRVLRYPAYILRRSRPVFANRAALLAYEDALANAAGVEDALQARPAHTVAHSYQLLLNQEDRLSKYGAGGLPCCDDTIRCYCMCERVSKCA